MSVVLPPPVFKDQKASPTPTPLRSKGLSRLQLITHWDQSKESTAHTQKSRVRRSILRNSNPHEDVVLESHPVICNLQKEAGPSLHVEMHPLPKCMMSVKSRPFGADVPCSKPWRSKDIGALDLNTWRLHKTSQIINSPLTNIIQEGKEHAKSCSPCSQNPLTVHLTTS